MATYNSIPRDDFHNAVVKWSLRKFHQSWTGLRTNTIQVYEIAKGGEFELHLSVTFDPTGRNVWKFHFTLRKGSKKGNDAFAWYNIHGFNKNATIGVRENADHGKLFSDKSIPASLKIHVDKIDTYAQEIFAEAKSYIKI